MPFRAFIDSDSMPAGGNKKGEMSLNALSGIY